MSDTMGRVLSNKIGNLSNNGITEPDLASAIKNDRSSLADKTQQINNLEVNKADKTDVNNALALKVNKDEVTNNMTPKGNSVYTALPTSGSTIGDYYYCSDGDGTHGAGNYVWNGTAWYFGGTGDEGYNKLNNDISLYNVIKNNYGYEQTKTFAPQTVKMTYNGGFWGSAQVAKNFDIGLYVVVFKFKISSISGNVGTMYFTPQLLKSGVVRSLGVFGSVNTLRASSNGEDIEVTLKGYVSVLEAGNYNIGLGGSNVNGVTFTFEFKEFVALLADESDYTTLIEGKYLSLYDTYGFQSQYRFAPVISKSAFNAIGKATAISGNIADGCSGDGTDTSPFTSGDATCGILPKIKELTKGGKVVLPVGRYIVNSPIKIPYGNIALIGEIWGYNEDPNGVWGIKNGTRLKLANGINGIVCDSGLENPYYRNGCSFKELGIQGSVENSNTAGMLDYSNPSHAGIALLSGRTDQCNFERISCSGLGVAVLIKSGMNVDACTFDWINGDGCNVGLMLLTAITYYTIFKNSLFSDNPGHGVIIDSAATNLTFDNLMIVRSGGAITAAQKAVYPAAAAYFNGLQYCKIQNCFINDAGQWNEYFTNGSGGNAGTVNIHYDTDTVGMYFAGSNNDLYNNVIRGGQSNALMLTGAGNRFSGNLYRSAKCAKITGNSNYMTNETYDLTSGSADAYALEVSGSWNHFSNCRYTKPIHITGEGNVFDFCYASASISGVQIVIDGNNNTIRGIDSSLITNNGTGNKIL